MGREARCVCRWGENQGKVTALLESGELIVRGDIRRHVALNALEHVSVQGDDLEFEVSGEGVRLALGAAPARRWADAIQSPPPTLARKLGITTATRLHITGAVDDDALRTAIAGAAEVVDSFDVAALAIVRTDDRAVLETWAEAAASGTQIPPIWIVYVKGRNAPLGERSVRETMVRFSFVDTKVAAVSERLTALRFIKKRP